MDDNNLKLGNHLVPRRDILELPHSIALHFLEGDPITTRIELVFLIVCYNWLRIKHHCTPIK